jgi:hypothetical protein
MFRDVIRVGTPILELRPNRVRHKHFLQSARLLGIDAAPQAQVASGCFMALRFYATAPAPSRQQTASLDRKNRFEGHELQYG